MSHSTSHVGIIRAAGMLEQIAITGGRSLEKVARLARSLKEWLKSRPRLEIDESATWFLLLFVYAYGLTTDGLGFKMAGLIPHLTAPQVSLAMVLFCLIVSLVVLVEPLLPCKIRRWEKAVRRSPQGQFLRGISVLFAFALGMVTGFSLLAEKVPTISWLIDPVAYVGFLIFIVMGIRLAFLAWIMNWHAGRPGEDSGREVTL